MNPSIVFVLLACSVTLAQLVTYVRICVAHGPSQSTQSEHWHTPLASWIAADCTSHAAETARTGERG